MKLVKQTTNIETRQYVRVEFTQAEVAQVLLNHWHTVAKTTPLDMSVTAKTVAFKQDEDGVVLVDGPICLEVTFHKREDAEPAAPAAPGYWECRIQLRSIGETTRWVFARTRDEVGRCLAEQYPSGDILCWERVGKVHERSPAGVRETTVLEGTTR